MVSNVEAAGKADTLVLVVKPRIWAASSTSSPLVARPGSSSSSLAAGITTAFIEARLPYNELPPSSASFQAPTPTGATWSEAKKRFTA